MKKSLVSGFLGLLICCSALAQNERVQIEMPRVDNEEVLERELQERRKGRPDMFAVRHNVSISPTTEGIWESEGANSVWAIEIVSEGALSLNFGFSKFDIPDGAELRIFQPETGIGIRPFTSMDVEAHGELWTPIVAGDHVAIELVVPTTLIPNVSIELGFVNHDFEGFGGLKPENASERSGACNLDVVCTEVDGWGVVDDYRDIINAVGAYTLNGNETCSGSLINNTANDGTPYFLTAEHCGISPNNASSMVAYWNYQNETCRQPGSAESGGAGSFPGPSTNNWDEFNSGAIHRAEWANGDFCLVEFDDDLDSSTGPFLAGWNRTDEAPASAIAIHHPGVEEKRISFENDPLSITDQVNNAVNQNANFLRVEDWDIGTTEGGSSGSPVFNADKQIVGDLCCGFAACGNDDADWYGMLAKNWEGGGSIDTRLKDWLDPMGTEPMDIDGLDAAFAVGPSESGFLLCSPAEIVLDFSPSGAFSGSVTYSIDGLPTGVESTFSVNPILVGESTTLTLTGDLTSDFQMVVTGVDDSGGTGNTTISVDIENGIAEAPQNVAPANGATEIALSAEFQWTGDFADYEWQLSDSQDFTTIIESSENLSSGDYIVNNLAVNTTYYWRTRTGNICGPTEWSETFSFTTVAEDLCSIYDYAGGSLTIEGSEGSMVEAVVDIALAGSVDQVVVANVQGSHSWIADLTFTLISPEGTSVELLSEICDGEDDFNIGFSDFGSDEAYPCPPIDGQLYRPENLLAEFIGEEVLGEWILRIEDSADQDAGALDSFDLELCGDFGTSVTEIALPKFEIFPNPVAEELNVRLLSNIDAEGNVSILDATGKIILQSVIAGQKALNLNVQSLASGLYFVQVPGAQKNSMVRQKFVKK